MDKWAWLIAGIVALVAFVGLLTVYHPDFSTDLTGNVVGGNTVFDACSHCDGTPVCAGKGNQAIDYPNACAANCDGAKVLYPNTCDKIPIAH